MLGEKAKHSAVEQMERDMKRSSAVLFLDYTGMTVGEADRLRKKLRDAGVGYRVSKNSLIKRVLTTAGAEGASKFLKGTPTGVVFGFEDPVGAAKLTFEFLKDCQHVKVKGGVFEKKALTPKDAEDLSKMPSKVELQGQVLAMILSPASNLIRQIKAPAGRILGAIEAHEKKAESKGSESQGSESPGSVSQG